MSRKVVRMPVPKFSLPPAVDGAECHIIFGHNVEVRKVLMQFTAAAERLILSPEEARDVATKLVHYADMAEGKKVQG
jgi:cytidine deaminase